MNTPTMTTSSADTGAVTGIDGSARANTSGEDDEDATILPSSPEDAKTNTNNDDDDNGSEYHDCFESVNEAAAASAGTIMTVEGIDGAPVLSRGVENMAIDVENAGRLNTETAQTGASISTSSEQTNNGPTAETTTSGQLPAALLGSILDFMPYKDVRVALLAGKLMANVVSKQVNTINILRSSELVVPAARRFPNVTEVNCRCLTTCREIDGVLEQELSVDTAMHIVPFLTAFSKLTVSFLGGYGDLPEYDSVSCVTSTGHEAIFRGLIEQFCNSFRSRGLPGDLDLRGVLPIWNFDLGWDQAKKFECNAEQGSQCKLCRKICSFFPFSGVVRIDEEAGMCISAIERTLILKNRPDCSSLFQTDAALDGLLRFVEERKCPACIEYKKYSTPEDNKFLRKMKRKGSGSRKFAAVYYFREERQREIHDLVSAGFDATLQAFRRDDLMHNSRFSHPYSYEYIYDNHTNLLQCAREKEIWVRSSFEFLVSIGFDLDPDDFILLDPKDEPVVLRRMNGKEACLQVIEASETAILAARQATAVAWGSDSLATAPEEVVVEDDIDSSANTDGGDETEDDDVDNNPGSNPEAEAEAAVGGAAGGGTAFNSAVMNMRQEIMEIIQDAMAEEDDDANFHLLMHIVDEVGKED